MAEVETLNLMQKLAKIRAMSDVVTKDKKGYNYTYADITSILAKITAGMKKYGVSLIPQIVPETADVKQLVSSNTKFTKTGQSYEAKTTEMLVTADMIFRWVDDSNPEDFIDVPWFITGSQSDPSQAFGSGLTYCTRYFLCNYFQIAQADSDADAYRSKQKEAESSEDRTIAEGIISQFDTIIRTFLADNPEKSDDVKAFVKRYAKNGNYLAIKEPALAADLLSKFNEKFITK